MKKRLEYISELKRWVLSIFEVAGMKQRLLFVLGLMMTIGVFLLTGWDQGNPVPLARWHVEIKRGMPKKANEYDVIVIGSGFGGLSSGAMLAKHGYKVLVLEKNSTVGGLCSSYVKDGCRFCYGAEDLDGLGERGAVQYLFSMLGIQKTGLLVSNTYKFFDGARSLTVDSEPDGLEKALVRGYPTEEGALHRFFLKARQVYDEGYDAEMIKKWGIALPEELATQVMPEAWVKNYDSNHRNLEEWSRKAYQDVLDEYFSNFELKMVLSGFSSYIGSYPYNTSASSVVLRTFGYFFTGGYQVLGTAQHLAEVLAASIQHNGGQVLCDRHVDKILLGKQGVTGVRVGETVYVAPVIVCNASIKTAYLDLIPTDAFTTDFLNDIRTLPVGNSILALHVVVDKTLDSYPSILQDRHNRVVVAIPSKNDPSLAPKGKSTVVIRESARFASFIHNTQEDNASYLQERADALFAKGKALVPEVDEGGVIQRILTPEKLEELFAVPYGNVFTCTPELCSKKAGFRSPIRGLYMSSASSGCPGVESVIATGILCAHDIMGWKTESST
jgi:all-trans-retinol 13,14-reductase